MRILILAGLICLMSVSSGAQNYSYSTANYCDNVANDMVTVYIEMVQGVRKGQFNKISTVNASFVFQSFVKSYELAGCDPSQWRGKLVEIERELNLGD